MDAARPLDEAVVLQVGDKLLHDAIANLLRADSTNAAIAGEPRQSMAGAIALELAKQLRPFRRHRLAIAARDMGEPGLLQGKAHQGHDITPSQLLQSGHRGSEPL